MIIIMVSGKTQPERFYVILRRSGTKKNKGDISPNKNLDFSFFPQINRTYWKL
jgi:hypothetical protein